MAKKNVDLITLDNDNAADVRFHGESIAEVSSYNPDDRPSRWTDMILYRSTTGKYVCQVIGRTTNEGERTRYTVHVCSDENELIEKLGHGWLAKDLYDDVGIDHAIDI